MKICNIISSIIKIIINISIYDINTINTKFKVIIIIFSVLINQIKNLYVYVLLAKKKIYMLKNI